MTLQEAADLSYLIFSESGTVESILMSDPPNNELSYVVQVRTKESTPRVYWLGPDITEAYSKKDEINAI